jgi:glutamate synthase (NADPH/NADH) large chain
MAPIPSLLLTAAVHHHLVREKTRTQVGLVVEAGDAREVHHMALLIGYGAAAVNPYLAFETIEDMAARELRVTDVPREGGQELHQGAGKGVLKVMSKMGISTVASYTGAQIFEALGLGQELVDEYFTGTVSRLGGIGLDEIAEEVRPATPGLPDRPRARAPRARGGRRVPVAPRGRAHLFNPRRCSSCSTPPAPALRRLQGVHGLVDDQSSAWPPCAACSSFDTEATAPPVPIDEVEPVSEIVKRFSTGAMSYGSISAEAHETLAIAMNRLGAKSNTGEGGEDPSASPDPNGDSRAARSSRSPRAASASPAST